MDDESHLQALEQQIRTFSREKQLWLIERLVHGLRAQAMPTPLPSETELAKMAADPDIQRELRTIEVDFAGTEVDGLERV